MLIQQGDKLINTRNWSDLVKPEQIARDAKSDRKSTRLNSSH